MIVKEGVDTMNNEMNERIAQIRYEIDEAVRKAGRSDGVSLMAVSKNHPYEAVADALGCNMTLFGENRVQEIAGKFTERKEGEFTLRLIGHLQSNKVKKAVSLVDGIDSVDSEKLVRLIDKESEKVGKVMPVLLEIDTAKDGTKHGFGDKDDLFRTLDVISSLNHVKVEGLMTVGPQTSVETKIYKAFNSLRLLQDECAQRFPDLDFHQLSMGMSGDFRIAIEAGSTVVRIGTAIFGSRGY